MRVLFNFYSLSDWATEVYLQQHPCNRLAGLQETACWQKKIFLPLYVIGTRFSVIIPTEIHWWNERQNLSHFAGNKFKVSKTKKNPTLEESPSLWLDIFSLDSEGFVSGYKCDHTGEDKWKWTAGV